MEKKKKFVLSKEERKKVMGMEVIGDAENKVLEEMRKQNNQNEKNRKRL